MIKIIPNVFSIFLVSVLIITGHAQKKVAIFTFKNESDKIKLDKWETLVPGILRSKLADDEQFLIVERENLDQLFEEYKLSLSGFSDSISAQGLSQLSGADYLISGTIHTLNEKYWIDVNITNVKTAEMSLEQVSAYDGEHVNEMAGLLAGNIRFRLNGSGEYQEKVELRKFPTTYFFLATVGFGTAAYIYDKSYKENYDKYHLAEGLDDYDKYYDKANTDHKISIAMASTAAVTLVGTFYCWIRNRSIKDITAFSEREKKIIPQVEIGRRGVSRVGFKIIF